MSEPKKFVIPENVNATFEVIQNVRLKDLFIFGPSAFVILIVWLMPILFYVKLGVAIFLIVAPLGLVIIRPIRQNIPAWKHITWIFGFARRQRRFFYRKEGVHR